MKKNLYQSRQIRTCRIDITGYNNHFIRRGPISHVTCGIHAPSILVSSTDPPSPYASALAGPLYMSFIPRRCEEPSSLSVRVGDIHLPLPREACVLRLLLRPVLTFPSSLPFRGIYPMTNDWSKVAVGGSDPLSCMCPSWYAGFPSLPQRLYTTSATSLAVLPWLYCDPAACSLVEDGCRAYTNRSWGSEALLPFPAEPSVPDACLAARDVTVACPCVSILPQLRHSTSQADTVRDMYEVPWSMSFVDGDSRLMSLPVAGVAVSMEHLRENCWVEQRSEVGGCVPQSYQHGRNILVRILRLSL